MSNDAEPTVFVVDDDLAVRKSLDMLLRSVGLKAEGYSSAQEFLDRFNPDQPGCLLLDVRMPGMSGLELQRRLGAEGHRFPVIVLTASPEAKVRARALAAGAFGFLGKPFSDDTLIACLDGALAARCA